MKKVLLLLTMCVLGFSEVQFGGPQNTGISAPIINAGAFGITSIDGNFVQRLVIRTVPGLCEKIYIGTSPINVASLAGVVKIMFPNCSGGLSDEYVIEDRTGNDGIDTTNFYIASSASSAVLIEYNQTGSLGARNLVPILNGPIAETDWVANQFSLSAANGAAIVQLCIIPGQSGKFYIGTSYLPFIYWLKVLFPNNGVVTGTITDKFVEYAHNGNGLSSVIPIKRDVVLESLVVDVWQYQ